MELESAPFFAAFIDKMMILKMNKRTFDRRIILASGSPFRRELLARLELPFESVSPEIDEAPKNGESAHALVERLALKKAQEVAKSHPDALIIGSDQVAMLDGNILGKPGDHERAFEQLSAASGRRVTFLTGLCLFDSGDGTHQLAVEPFEVEFRELDSVMIDAYLKWEQPYNCAGSFKSEGLGIALFERLTGDDPTALIGLPLIQLVRMLETAGARVV